MSPNLWSRVKRAQIVQVLVVYAGASWLVLEVASVFIDEFGLPGWFFQAAILLPLIGLVILGTTAWVQMRTPESQTPASMRQPWEVYLVDVKETEAGGRLPHLTWGRVAIAGIIAISLLFGFAGVFVLLKPPAGDAGSPAIPASVALGMAVLPFRAVGPGMDFWRVSNDPPLPVGRFYRGAYAACQHNWAEVERQSRALRAGASAALEVGGEESQRA